jgi:5-methylcytosine-specific restriction endonuclease McrA
MQDCLVLDINYRPVGVTNYQNAVKLWWEDVATVVKEDASGRMLHSSRFTIGMPRVIVVKNAWKRKVRAEVPFSRRNVAVRDNSECQYCGHFLRTAEYTYDHVIPRSEGGKSSWTNLVLACGRCNTRKANKSLEECGMRLLQTPVRPKRTEEKYRFRLKISTLRPEWREWSSWLYWNIELEP